MGADAVFEAKSTCEEVVPAGEAVVVSFGITVVELFKLVMRLATKICSIF